MTSDLQSNLLKLVLLKLLVFKKRFLPTKLNVLTGETLSNVVMEWVYEQNRTRPCDQIAMLE